MRITGVRAVLLSYVYREDQVWKWSGGKVDVWNTCLVEVRTDEGITGLGEAGDGHFVPEAAAALISHFRPMLLGTNPLEVGSDCVLCIRPENIDLDGPVSASSNTASGQVAFAAYLGNTLRYDVDLGGGVVFKVDVRDPWHHVPLAMGVRVGIAFPAGVTVAIAAG